MSLIFITVLLGLALLAFMLKNPRHGFAFMLLGLATIFFIGTGVLPKLALGKLQSREQATQPIWGKSNGILVLGAGTVKWPGTILITSSTFGYSRVMEVARLYLNCRKRSSSCKIIASGGDPSHKGNPEAEVMARELKDLGVPESDMILEAKSHNTFQNAQYSSALVQPLGLERIYLVTSGFHMTRSLMLFAYFGVRAEAAPSDQLSPVSSRWPLAYNFTMFDLALHEFIAMARFHFYNYMEWNTGA